MPLLEWDSRYSVNIREIDRQHETLFGLVNRLYDAMREGKGRSVLGGVLDELVAYTAYHFQTEEKLFRVHGYPDAAAHKAEHDALAAEARTFAKRFEAQEILVTTELLTFLRDWLNHHIVGSDKRYMEFLHEKGVR